MSEPALAALRAGDEAAFTALVERHSGPMLRLALGHVPSRAVAEEVVQETWVAVLEGLDRFEGRAQLRTWLFRILANRAKTRGERERRTVPFATLEDDEHWPVPPRRWEESPELSLAAPETLARVRAAIATLPPAQRLVITLRDLDGWDGPQVSAALAISAGNQRVLLHRARCRVRAALEDYVAA